MAPTAARAPSSTGPIAALGRRRAEILAAVLILPLLAAAVWMLGVQARDALFPPDGGVSAAAAENLLLAIDRDSAGRLAPDELAAPMRERVAMPAAVRRAIRRAARDMGVDAGYLAAVAARESSFDPNLRAQGTSALGLYQFTDATWLRVVKLFGARHGLDEYARRIAIDDRGTVWLTDARLRARLLALRADPDLATQMAAELGRDNQARLARLLGRPVTPAETYIAHFLGVAQAARMIDAAHSTPRLSGTRLLPVAAGSNPGVFAPDGRAASVGAIVGRIEAYFDREVPRYARL